MPSKRHPTVGREGRPRYVRVAVACLVVVVLGAAAAIAGARSHAAVVAAAAAPLKDSRLPPVPADTAGANVRGAQQLVLAHLGAPKFPAAHTVSAPGPAFDISSVRKPVWLLATGAEDPEQPVITSAFAAAAKAANVPYHICPAQSTPSGNAICLAQAAQAHAGSAVIWGQDPRTIAVPLQKARAAGVKIVNGNNDTQPGVRIASNTDAAVTFNYYQAGQLVGAYAVAARGAATDAICITIPEFIVGTAVCDGFSAALHRYCPPCKYAEKSVPLAQLANYSATVSAAVLGDSKLNFIMSAFDNFNAQVGAALRTLGKKPGDILVGGENGTTPTAQSICCGGYQVVSAGQDADWWGWGFFDAGARAAAGASPSRTGLTAPNELLTKETWHFKRIPTYANMNLWYGLGNGHVYQAGYEALWHVSKAKHAKGG